VKFTGFLVLFLSLLLPLAAHAKQNDVMGKIEFQGTSRVAKTSGVWVDQQYIGYLSELKGSKSVLLLPGEHTITVRQDGYKDFTQQVLVQPGQTNTVVVSMLPAPTGPVPHVTATVKIAVDPDRAAVFVDGLFIGHVKEFQGVGRGLLVAPGTRHISIALPGYQTFETDIHPIANQTVEIKTHLIKSNGPATDPLISRGAGATTDSGKTAAALAH
jgi:hypothetical protein